jgi:hypothetical protein
MSDKMRQAELIADAAADPSFGDIVQLIAVRIGAPTVDAAGTNISSFKTNYSTVLDRANGGSVEVVTRGRQRFVLLAEEHAQTLMASIEDGRTVGEAFAGLPFMPAAGERPRAMSVAAAEQYRLPR